MNVKREQDDKTEATNEMKFQKKKNFSIRFKMNEESQPKPKCFMWQMKWERMRDPKPKQKQTKQNKT